MKGESENPQIAVRNKCNLSTCDRFSMRFDDFKSMFTRDSQIVERLAPPHAAFKANYRRGRLVESLKHEDELRKCSGLADGNKSYLGCNKENDACSWKKLSIFHKCCRQMMIFFAVLRVQSDFRPCWKKVFFFFFVVDSERTINGTH